MAADLATAAQPEKEPLEVVQLRIGDVTVCPGGGDDDLGQGQDQFAIGHGPIVAKDRFTGRPAVLKRAYPSSGRAWEGSVSPMNPHNLKGETPYLWS